MSETTFVRALRENWHLTLVLALAVAGVGVGLLKAFGGGDAAVAVREAQLLYPDRVLSEEQMRAVITAPPGPRSATVQEEKQKVVNGHRARYDANPNGLDAEVLLRAMGNLYKQTGDLKNATWAYQTFLERFPKNSGRPAVYMELVGCYELLKDADNLGRVYLEMLNAFPPDSNEYKFAEAGLKLSDLRIKQRNPNAKPAPGPEGTFRVQTLSDGSNHYVASESRQGTDASTPRQSAGP